MIVGTVNYAAPEQLMDASVDGRADQYSLAATAYHLLTGRAPFEHSNPAVVISHHLNAEPRPLSELRPDLAELDASFARALSKNPRRPEVIARIGKTETDLLEGVG
jgi:serine/threonine-protein kinase